MHCTHKTLVRLLIKVSADTASVSTSKREFGPSSPRTTVLPVTGPKKHCGNRQSDGCEHGTQQDVDRALQIIRQRRPSCGERLGKEDQRRDQKPAERGRSVKNFDAMVDRECNLF